MDKIKTKLIEITCSVTGSGVTRDAEGKLFYGDEKTYTVAGHELPDGRVVTLGSGVDGKDSLWPSIEAYEPNGLDVFVDWRHTGEEGELSTDDIRVADEDNVTYGESLLRSAER